jgi:phage I-like protein
MDRNLLLSTTLFALVTASGAAPDWIQLTPSTSTFSSRDGRGPFTIKDPAALIRASMANGHSIRIDYNHAIDLAAKAGLPSPAAGWIEEILAHGPGNEPGLWGRVKWTPAGAKSIVDGEYRFISPVLLSKKDSDELVAIGGAALCNDPALVMTSLFSNQENDPVNRTALCDALSLPATATSDDIIGAVKKGSADTKKKLADALGVPANGTDEDLMAAVTKVGAQASTYANVARVLQAAGLTGTDLDDATTVALCAKLKGSAVAPGGKDAATLQGQVDELQKQLASLQTSFAGSSATRDVEAAISAGKLAPAQKEWAIDYCSRDPAGFKTFVGKQPRILEGGRVALDETVPEGGLTDTESKLCATLGIKPEDFKATRATLKKEGAQ